MIVESKIRCNCSHKSREKFMQRISDYSPEALKVAIGRGLLSFPVSTFDNRLELDERRYAENFEVILSHRPAGIFAAGGTGEFFSLDTDEVDRLVRRSVELARGAVPVIAPVGYGTRSACELARRAEAAGADGLLLFPPYLTEADQSGLARHIEQVCAATRLGVIVYSRGNARLGAELLPGLAERCANLIGYKDGIGDIELMTRVYTTMGDRLSYVGGLPTAETFALPYLEMGVTTYSSAIFNFLPRWATDFYDAVRRRDHAHVYRELRDFVMPYTALRNRRRGYAVSIVKAGMRAVGRDSGGVRAPLVDLDDAEFAQLQALIGTRS